MKALISIHDVMPETLPLIRSILGELPEQCHRNLTLLVVPGRKWSASDIEQLRYWQACGYRLAGHGWLHEARQISSVYHRVHSGLISRNVAEHLSLETDELRSLLKDNHKWFWDNELDSPDFYVPPAWAMGKLHGDDLANSPFRYFENMGGVYDAVTRKFVALPLAGFEADTVFRSTYLAVWNVCNYRMASEGRPLRIAIHPEDFRLRRASQLRWLLSRVTEAADYRDLFPPVMLDKPVNA